MPMISLRSMPWTSFAYALVSGVGTLWAFTRGGQDFAVFYTAALHVLEGRPEQLYVVSPDRFLYAPGFAWWLAPLALLPQTWALGVWTAFKIGVGAALIGAWARVLPPSARADRLTAIAVLVTARFWLIDFQYGQINLLILAAASFALLDCVAQVPRGRLSIWVALGALSAVKLLTAPLLLLALARPRRFLAALAGGLLVLLAPVVSLGLSGTIEAHLAWFRAIADKGLPYYTHNQSFLTFLHRTFGDAGARPVFSPYSIDLSLHWLSPETIQLLAAVFSLVVVVALLAGLVRIWRGRGDASQAARTLALLPLPHYLVWKPYFLFAFPVVLAATSLTQGKVGWLAYGVAAAAFTLSGFDVVGVLAATYLESLSVLLWGALVFIALARGSRPR